jgi:hypothetical protein
VLLCWNRLLLRDLTLFFNVRSDPLLFTPKPPPSPLSVVVGSYEWNDRLLCVYYIIARVRACYSTFRFRSQVHDWRRTGGRVITVLAMPEWWMRRISPWCFSWSSQSFKLDRGLDSCNGTCLRLELDVHRIRNRSLLGRYGRRWLSCFFNKTRVSHGTQIDLSCDGCRLKCRLEES